MYDFVYTRPADLDAALALLREDDQAQPVSGGQTLMPVLRARLAAPSTLVDLARLEALGGIRDEGGRLVIGAAETHAGVAASAVVRAAVPALARLAGGIGDVQVRHRGTIGGSVANNDPAACYPSALLALDADVVTSSRTLAAQDFLAGMFATVLEPGEIVTAVTFPHCTGAHYEKFKNPASRFALIGVFAAWLDGRARIAVTGGGTGVFRWHEAETHLDGGNSANDLDDVPLDLDHFTSDLHGSAEYRRHLTRVIVRRALAKDSGKSGISMDIGGSYVLPCTQMRAWAALNDTELLKASLKGCERLERLSDTEFSGTVSAKIGPVSARFSGKLSQAEIDAPHSCRMVFEGQGGIAGFARGSALVTLADEAGDTRLSYQADAVIGGKLAQMGSRLVEGTARKMAEDFFGKFAAALAAERPETLSA